MSSSSVDPEDTRSMIKHSVTTLPLIPFRDYVSYYVWPSQTSAFRQTADVLTNISNIIEKETSETN